MKKLLARVAAAATAFNVGRTVGKQLDQKGFHFDDPDLSDELRRVMGSSEGRFAFAAGIATLAWGLVTRREMLLVFALGALVGWRAFEKIMDLFRRESLPESTERAAPTEARVVDTTGGVSA